MASRHTRFKTLYIIFGTAVGLFILFNYVILPIYVRHGSTLTVPDVTGLPLEEAQRTLKAEGLQPVEGGSRSDPKIPPGNVVSQNPPPSAVVKGGRHIYLTISGGEPRALVPELRGRSPRDAKFALERNGLTLGAVEYSSSDLYPENTIMSQSVEPGMELARGQAVGIVVSRGQASGKAAVPGLIGRSVGEADRMLSDVGLKMGNITYQASLDLLPNTIVDQFPRAGDSLAIGGSVDLFVVSAEKPKEEH
jgi:beta-lactam-binding protein with PASTA domain